MEFLTPKRIIREAIATAYTGPYRFVESGGIEVTAGDESLYVKFRDPELFDREQYESTVASLLSEVQNDVESREGEGSIEDTLAAVEAAILTEEQQQQLAITRLAIAADKAVKLKSKRWLEAYATALLEVAGKDKQKDIDKAVKGKRGANAFRANQRGK